MQNDRSTSSSDHETSPLTDQKAKLLDFLQVWAANFGELADVERKAYLDLVSGWEYYTIRHAVEALAEEYATRNRKPRLQQLKRALYQARKQGLSATVQCDGIGRNVIRFFM